MYSKYYSADVLKLKPKGPTFHLLKWSMSQRPLWVNGSRLSMLQAAGCYAKCSCPRVCQCQFGSSRPNADLRSSISTDLAAFPLDINGKPNYQAPSYADRKVSGSETNASSYGKADREVFCQVVQLKPVIHRSPQERVASRP